MNSVNLDNFADPFFLGETKEELRRIRHDRKGDDASDLESRDRNHRQQRIFQRMSKEDFSFRYAPGPCKTNVIRAHDFKHFTAYQSHD